MKRRLVRDFSVLPRTETFRDFLDLNKLAAQAGDVAGKAAGAAAGAAIGSVVPGLGTKIGAVVGYGAAQLTVDYLGDYLRNMG